MTAKLEMYRRLNNALIIAVAVSLGWITFEVNHTKQLGHPLFFVQARVRIHSTTIPAQSVTALESYRRSASVLSKVD